MEYLMTYGWALLVIVIVIAVLLYINPFRAPEQCIFDNAGLYCERPILQVNGIVGNNQGTFQNVLSARITNGERRTITITGIACARGSARPIADSSQWGSFSIPAGVDLASQETLELRDIVDINGGLHYAQCITVPDKDPATGALNLNVPLSFSDNLKLRPNEDFSGRLWIMYRFADEPVGAPSKLVGANLVTRAQ